MDHKQAGNEPQEPVKGQPWFYPLIAFLAIMLLAHFALSSRRGLLANIQKESGNAACVSSSAPSLSLSCVSFSGHLYAVADIDLQSQEIVFTTSDDQTRKTFPEIASNLSRAGREPLLITNAGIYGTDNRPLGLLISPQGKLHNANTKTASGPVHGNFSWDSAVFQISDDGIASIVAARNWQDTGHVIAATQSGPQLASAGRINQRFQANSQSFYRRTAIGVDQSNRKLVHLVVSREPVTLFELATFMVNELHCSEALHLDGGFSAFYIPSAPGKFLFFDPGEKIVTVLSVVDKREAVPPRKRLGQSKR